MSLPKNQNIQNKDINQQNQDEINCEERNRITSSGDLIKVKCEENEFDDSNFNTDMVDPNANHKNSKHKFKRLRSNIERHKSQSKYPKLEKYSKIQEFDKVIRNDAENERIQDH